MVAMHHAQLLALQVSQLLYSVHSENTKEAHAAKSKARRSIGGIRLDARRVLHLLGCVFAPALGCLRGACHVAPPAAAGAAATAPGRPGSSIFLLATKVCH